MYPRPLFVQQATIESWQSALIQHLDALRTLGVNHVLFNVKFSGRDVDDVLAERIEFVVPEFSLSTKN